MATGANPVAYGTVEGGVKKPTGVSPSLPGDRRSLPLPPPPVATLGNLSSSGDRRSLPQPQSPGTSLTAVEEIKASSSAEPEYEYAEVAAAWLRAREAATVRRHSHLRRPWYRGEISRETACMQLRACGMQEGDYVVRARKTSCSDSSSSSSSIQGVSTATAATTTTLTRNLVFIISVVVKGAVQHWRLYLPHISSPGVGAATLEDIVLPGVRSVTQAVELLASHDRRHALSRRLPALQADNDGLADPPPPPPRPGRLRVASG